MTNCINSETLVSHANSAHSTRKVTIAAAQSKYIAPSTSPGSRQKVTPQTGQVLLILKWERNIAPMPQTGHRLRSARLSRVLLLTRSIAILTPPISGNPRFQFTTRVRAGNDERTLPPTTAVLPVESGRGRPSDAP